MIYCNITVILSTEIHSWCINDGYYEVLPTVETWHKRPQAGILTVLDLNVGIQKGEEY